jgi:membrane associated rhomboid family serine protease
VAKLIAANIVVYLLQKLFPVVTKYLALYPELVVERLWVWQLGTYMFLHGGFIHLFFNMFILWMFGAQIEAAWGPRHFLRYYLICGLGGAVGFMVFNYHGAVVGASGAVFGLYVAFAMMFPNQRIMMLFFPFPIKAKYLVMGIAAIQLFNGLTGPAGIAYFAHLGGMAAGLLFFRSDVLQRWRFKAGPQKKWRQYMNDRQQESNPAEQGNIDSILDKISEKGYDNLSETEKRILDNYSRDRRDGSE